MGWLISCLIRPAGVEESVAEDSIPGAGWVNLARVEQEVTLLTRLTPFRFQRSREGDNKLN